MIFGPGRQRQAQPVDVGEGVIVLFQEGNHVREGVVSNVLKQGRVEIEYRDGSGMVTTRDIQDVTVTVWGDTFHRPWRKRHRFGGGRRGRR